MRTKDRALFIDLLRALALLVMIEVHVFNEMLGQSFKSGSFYSILNFVNGLVAPTFLFVSGFVFVLSLQKGADELRNFGMKFWKKISRIGMIFIGGYSLHTPYFSLQKLIHNWSPVVERQLFIVDILQCIGAGLLLLIFARMIFKSETAYYNFILITLVLVLALSPFFWKIDFTGFMPVPIAAYLNKSTGSLFPVFPWFNFLLTGAFFSKFYISYRGRNEEKKFAEISLILGAVLFIAGWIALDLLPSHDIDIIRPHPLFYLERLGVVLFLLGSCWFYVNMRNDYKSFMLDVSRESLLIYWFHLQLIYRKFYGGTSMVSIFGNQLNPFWTTILTVAICVLMIFFAKIWGWLKINRTPLSKKGVIAFLTICGLVFLINGIFLIDV
jgi:uncharacterized membrane protein